MLTRTWTQTYAEEAIEIQMALRHSPTARRARSGCRDCAYAATWKRSTVCLASFRSLRTFFIM